MKNSLPNFLRMKLLNSVINYYASYLLSIKIFLETLPYLFIVLLVLLCCHGNSTTMATYIFIVVHSPYKHAHVKLNMLFTDNN